MCSAGSFTRYGLPVHVQVPPISRPRSVDPDCGTVSGPLRARRFCIVLPLWEFRKEMATILKAAYRSCRSVFDMKRLQLPRVSLLGTCPRRDNRDNRKRRLLFVTLQRIRVFLLSLAGGGSVARNFVRDV